METLQDTTGKYYYQAGNRKFYFRPDSKQSMNRAATQAKLYEIALTVLDKDTKYDY